jgi:hypothetical protein
MRWRSREGPWGSHHDDARALKCVTSVGSTEDFEVLCGEEWADVDVDERRAAEVRIEGIRGACSVSWGRHACWARFGRARRTLGAFIEAITLIL